jgi:hypothetical protein
LSIAFCESDRNAEGIRFGREDRSARFPRGKGEPVGLSDRPYSPVRRGKSSQVVDRPSGGRAWWAHFEFTRINIELTILPKKIENLREAGALTSIAG